MPTTLRQGTAGSLRSVIADWRARCFNMGRHLTRGGQEPGRFSHRAGDATICRAVRVPRVADKTAVAAAVHECQFPQIDANDEAADFEARPHRLCSASEVQFALATRTTPTSPSTTT